MDAAKKYLATYYENNPDKLPFISFKENPKHTVKLISSKVDKIKGTDGNEVEGVTFLVSENSVKGTFFTSSIGLIKQLAEFSPNDTVTIEMKRKSVDGQFKSYYVVSTVKMEGSLGDDYENAKLRENPQPVDTPAPARPGPAE